MEKTQLKNLIKQQVGMCKMYNINLGIEIDDSMNKDHCILNFTMKNQKHLLDEINISITINRSDIEKKSEEYTQIVVKMLIDLKREKA